MNQLVQLAQWLAFLVHYKFLSKEHQVQVFQHYAKKDLSALTFNQVAHDLHTSKFLQDVGRFGQMQHALPQALAQWSSQRVNIPKKIAGYIILRELGRGGMGAVYLGCHERHGRLDAIKVLRSTDPDDPDVQRFTREANAMASAQHPSVAHIYGMGEEQGLSYLVMEYVRGETLKHATKLASKDQVVELIIKTAQGIGALNARGITHRDIKPDNVMVTEDGWVKIMDTGLAKDESLQRMTQTGELLGTPAFMPPEQVCGEKDVGPRADTYSLAATAYTLLRGGIPLFRVTPMRRLLIAIMEATDTPQRALKELVESGVEQRIAQVIANALHHDPQQRLLPVKFGEELKAAQDAVRSERERQIQQQLGELSVVKGQVADQQQTIDKQASRGRKLIGVLVVLAALAVILAGVALFVVQQRKQADQLAQANKEKAQAAEELARERAASLSTAKALSSERATSLAAAEKRALVQLHSELAALYESKYEWKKALAQLKKAIAVWPKDAWAKHAEVVGSLLHRRAQLYFRLRDDECINDMVAAAKIQADPFRTEALFWSVIFEFTLGNQSGERGARIEQMQDGHYKRMLQVYAATLTVDRRAQRERNLTLIEEIPAKNRGWVWYFIHGHALSDPPTKDNLELALLSFDESIRLNPNYFMSYYNRATTLTRLSTRIYRNPAEQGHVVRLHGRAVNDFRKLFKLSPGWYPAEMNFAESVCAIAHTAPVNPSRKTDRPFDLLEESLNLIRPYWSQSDEKLGVKRFMVGFRMIQLLQVKRNRNLRLQKALAQSRVVNRDNRVVELKRICSEVEIEAHRVWARLSQVKLTKAQNKLLKGAINEFGFENQRE